MSSMAQSGRIVSRHSHAQFQLWNRPSGYRRAHADAVPGAVASEELDGGGDRRCVPIYRIGT